MSKSVERRVADPERSGAEGAKSPLRHGEVERSLVNPMTREPARTLHRRVACFALLHGQSRFLIS